MGRGLLVGTLLVALAACAQEPAAAPAELIGRWGTEASGYEDRFLKITAAGIEFGTGGGRSTRHLITGVAAQTHSSGTLYTVTYDLDGETHGAVQLIYESGAEPVLRLKNRPAYGWTRGSD